MIRLPISTHEAPESVIPYGCYCYWPTGGDATRRTAQVCPFWASDSNAPPQEYGYCHYLGRGDMDGGTFLLWDMCKECDINDDEETDWMYF